MIHRLRIAFAVVLMAVVISLHAQKKPDFAFPQKVEQQSRIELDNALHANNGQATVRALIDLVLARNSVDGETANSTVALVDSVCGVVSDPATSSLLKLLKARVLQSVYNAQSWVYNQRKQPLSPLPDDVLLWSGEQFCNTIYELCAEATANADALKAQSIDKWSSAVVIERQSIPLYPTLFEFACNEAVDLVRESMIQPLWVPWRLQCPWKMFIEQPEPTASNPAVKVLTKIFEEWIAFENGRTAPLVQADLKRIQTFCTEEETRLPALKALYNDTKDSEWSGLVLLTMNSVKARRDSTYIKDLQYNVKRFPAIVQLANLEQILGDAYKAGLGVSANGLAVPGDSVGLNLVKENLETGRIDIYRVLTNENPWNEWVSSKKADYQLVNTIPVSGNAGQWPVFSDESIKTTLREPGRYALVPSVSNVAVDPKENGARLLFNTEVMLIEHGLGRGTITAISTKDGKPLPNVEILDDKMKVLGRTGADGSFACPDNFNGNVWGRMGESVTTSMYLGRQGAINSSATLVGQVYPSLPLYRPGDSVDWAAALFMREGDKVGIASQLDVKAVVEDANGKTVKTDTLTTDMWGRVTLNVKLPKNGLQGTFRIIISPLQGNGRVYGNFTVSDYKLPTFEALFDKQASGATSTGGYKLVADVKSYSGFPIAGARLRGALGVNAYYSGSAEFASVEATSGDDGKIILDIPVALFNDAPFKSKNFYVEATITSPTGENLVKRWPLNIDTDYLFTVNHNPVKIVNNEVRLPINCSQGGENVSVGFKYSFLTGNKVVLTGETDIATPVIKVGNLPSGQYNVEISSLTPSDVFYGDTKFDVVMYRDTDTVPPVESVLWCASPSTVKCADHRAEITVGVSYPTHLLIQITANKESRFRVQPLATGMHTVALEIPDDASTARVNVAAMANGQYEARQFTLVDTTAHRSLRFEVESFRDKTISNTTETWKLRLRNFNSPQEQSAVMLDMFNASILAVSPGFKWDKAPQLPYTSDAKWYFNHPSSLSVWASSSVKKYKTVQLEMPVFQTWNMGFGASRILYKMSRAVSSANGMMMDEAVVEEASAMKLASAPHVTELAVEMEDAGTAGVETEVVKQVEDEGAYRESEVALALFRPLLVTEPDGTLSVSVTFPNANTRWQVLGTAYNRELLADTWQADVVASKPVMVQPNLPRFLRRGDNTVLSALVMNNLDKSQKITSVIEIFNPVTGTTVGTQTIVSELQANGSAKIIIPCDVTEVFGAMIGYRVKSSAGDFVDGEQSLIPVLEAQTRVLESKPFCITSNTTQYTLSLPGNWAPDKTVLEYCDSPVWTVVSALPGLMQDNLCTANQAAQTIFSAAMARCILKQNPEITNALKQWCESDKQDSTLVSMLSRNESLKAMVLSDTPWISASESQTERMSRLALLLAPDAIEASIAKGIAALKDFQTEEGGWKWSDGSTRPSEWVTNQVLKLLGSLNAQGTMPDDKGLNNAVGKALNWIDGITAKHYNKLPSGNYTNYTYMRLLFPQYQLSVKADAVISATVQNLIGRWKDLGVLAKAMAAQILFRRNYANVANLILQSLDEFARVTPENGMFWPSLSANRSDASAANSATATVLDTYALIDSQAEQLTRIAQWLVLQKQGQDWGTSTATTQVVGSIVGVAKEWITPSGGVTVTSSGKEISLPKNNIPGYFTVNLAAASHEIAIDRKSAASPAFGSLIYDAVQPFDSIKAAEIPTLSIAKETFVKDGNKMRRVTTGDMLNVGDLVTVQLTIKCKEAIDYVTISDQRPACIEPVEQLPGYVYVDGLAFYRQVRDASTDIFIDRLPQGTYQLTYTATVTVPGTFVSGIATVQSQYAPASTAHSAAAKITVK